MDFMFDLGILDIVPKWLYNKENTKKVTVL